MGAFLETPERSKHSDEDSSDKCGLAFGVSSMQGWRISMEDAHAATLDVAGMDGASFFAVLDGHAGDAVAKVGSGKLLPNILAAAEGKLDAALSTEETAQATIEKGFISLDDELRSLEDVHTPGSGSTCVACFVTKTHIIPANCGDSRVVLCRDGKAFFSSQDHKPMLEVERSRIQAAGGFVAMGRVNGSLAVSRALGDFGYKRSPPTDPRTNAVSCVPDVTMIPRSNDDEFLILACDGIWDVLTSEEAVQFVRDALAKTSSIQDVAEYLLDHCLALNSRDNMTVCIVTFPAARRGKSRVPFTSVPGTTAGADSRHNSDDEDEDEDASASASSGGGGSGGSAESAPAEAAPEESSASASATATGENDASSSAASAEDPTDAADNVSGSLDAVEGDAAAAASADSAAATNDGALPANDPKPIS